MSSLDREILKQLSLTQSDLARHLRMSRQAINAGLKQEGDYLDSGRMLRLYDSLRVGGDRRSTAVARILKDRFGFMADSCMTTSTISSPASFSDKFSEVWFFAGETLELTITKHVSSMRRHYADENKTLLYFFYNPNIGHQLAQHLKLVISSLTREEKKTAKIAILTCNAVMFMPEFVIFNPLSKEAKGFVRVYGGHFEEMDRRQTGQLAANFATAGVRSIGDEILVSSEGFDGITFEVLHKF